MGRVREAALQPAIAVRRSRRLAPKGLSEKRPATPVDSSFTAPRPEKKRRKKKKKKEEKTDAAAWDVEGSETNPIVIDAPPAALHKQDLESDEDEVTRCAVSLRPGWQQWLLDEPLRHSKYHNGKTMPVAPHLLDVIEEELRACFGLSEEAFYDRLLLFVCRDVTFFNQVQRLKWLVFHRGMQRLVVFEPVVNFT